MKDLIGLFGLKKQQSLGASRPEQGLWLHTEGQRTSRVRTIPSEKGDRAIEMKGDLLHVRGLISLYSYMYLHAEKHTNVYLPLCKH